MRRAHACWVIAERTPSQRTVTYRLNRAQAASERTIEPIADHARSVESGGKGRNSSHVADGGASSALVKLLGTCSRKGSVQCPYKIVGIELQPPSNMVAR